MNPTLLSSAIIAHCADAIIAQDLSGVVLAWNPAAERLLGYPVAEVIGTTPQLTKPAQASECAALFAAAAQGEATSSVTTLLRHRSGRAVAANLTVSPMLDEDQRVIGVSSILHPADPGLLRTQQRLLNMAYRDSLTGLSNRTQLLDRIDQAMKRDERSRHYGAVFFVDLDRFKYVNDTAGHLTGDKILVRAARRMEARLRKCDTVARWGGDEFVVLVEGLGDDVDAATSKSNVIARKLLSTLGVPYHVEGGMHRCPASIGAALFSGTQLSPTEVINHADRAMYIAKGGTGIHFHVDVAMTTPTADNCVAA